MHERGWNKGTPDRESSVNVVGNLRERSSNELKAEEKQRIGSLERSLEVAINFHERRTYGKKIRQLPACRFYNEDSELLVTEFSRISNFWSSRVDFPFPSVTY